MPTMRERVAERYPDLVPLLRQPEVGKLLASAVRNNWSSGVFMSKLRATRWFRTQSEAQRRWWVTARMDPGQARVMRQQFSAELVKQAATLGVQLNSKQVARYTSSGLAQGITPDSARGMANLLAQGLSKGGRMGAGAYKTAHAQVRAVGAGEWMREPPRAEAERWAADIALGRKTVEDFNAANAYAATVRYPHMADQIRAGATVAQIVAPAVEAYAREMDWDPAGLMGKIHTDPKHTGLLGIRDPKTKKMRLPSEYEAMTMARSRPDWWKTTRGRQEDSSKTLALLRAFGARR